MNDSPNAGRLYIIFCKPAFCKGLCSLRGRGNIVVCFSCGNVMETALFFCVPDDCTLHLLGRKIK